MLAAGSAVVISPLRQYTQCAMITHPNRPAALLFWLTLALAGCAAGTSSGDKPSSSSSAGVAGSGNTGGEAGGSSGAGGDLTGGSGGAAGGTGGTADLCGNGVVDAGETCDLAISAGRDRDVGGEGGQLIQPEHLRRLPLRQPTQAPGEQPA